MTDYFVRDIAEGIGNTGVRAAILKCATDQAGVTPAVLRILRAVAAAQILTGVPIATHTLGTGGDVQQDIFAEVGVDLTRVVIGHCDESRDIGYLTRLAERGSYLGFDHFGIDTIPFTERVAFLADLCGRGFAEHIVLSHDSACFTDAWDMTTVDWPNWHYCHIHDDVVPALLAHGVSQSDLDQMLITNPRTIFAGPTEPTRGESKGRNRSAADSPT
jgi:phosphotriesterase-related protein